MGFPTILNLTGRNLFLIIPVTCFRAIFVSRLPNLLSLPFVKSFSAVMFANVIPMIIFNYNDSYTVYHPLYYTSADVPREGVDFLNPKFSSKSLQDLISDCNSLDPNDPNEVKFCNMHLMALLQKKNSHSSSRTKINRRNLYRIISIQRNPKGQIYTLPDLHSSVHFSVRDEETVREIIFRLRFLRGKGDPLPANIIPSDTNYHEDECFVLNQDAVKTSGQ